MFLLFRSALYKVADINFYVNKGLLLLLSCSRPPCADRLSLNDPKWTLAFEFAPWIWYT